MRAGRDCPLDYRLTQDAFRGEPLFDCNVLYVVGGLYGNRQALAAVQRRVAAEPTARVVVNAKTGTVVISRNVRVTAAAVTHGTISVSIAATNEISQPGPFSQGQTAAVQNAEVNVTEPNKPMFLFQPGVDLRQIVDAVNQVGASPSSLIAILEALKTSGSLRAELIVI